MNGKPWVAVMALTVALAASAKTKVEFWFDTEDYTCNRSNDCIVRLANIFTEAGVRGHFNIVGYLAQFIAANGRQDVIDALKPHCLGVQTLWHSRHPLIGEYCDIADYETAYRRCLQEEAQAVGMVKAVFNRDELLFSVLPGINTVYVAFDVYADLGIRSGVVYNFDDGKRGMHWYCNQLQVQYNADHSGLYLQNLLKDDWTVDRYYQCFDKVADYERIVISMHPDMAIKRQHWDIENFLGGNLTEFGKWNPTAFHDPAVTERFYQRVREMLRRLKKDPRFELDDWETVLKNLKPRAKITRAEIPAIRQALSARLVPLEKPASWCIADCFQAAVRLLRGEKEYQPGMVYGFLERPEGVKQPVTIKAADLKDAAKRIEFKRHLPTSYEVGGVRIGPADFLFAALEVLATGAKEVTVVPRDQLGDIAGFAPGLANFKHKDRWIIFAPDFQDRYLSDRLRYQFWTFRYE